MNKRNGRMARVNRRVARKPMPKRVPRRLRMQTPSPPPRNLPKISVVMPYFERKSQLLLTLRSIEKSAQDSVEIIIVDDGSSSEPLDIDQINCRYPVKLIRIEPEDKKWAKNPSVAYNIGIDRAAGSIVVIQSPECLHCSDILTHAATNDLRSYYSYSCYGVGRENYDSIKQHLSDVDHLDKIDYYRQLGVKLAPMLRMEKTGSNTVADESGCWFNHPLYKPCAYNFVAAISRRYLDQLGGFDERLANGIAYDDDDFLRRVRQVGIPVLIVPPENAWCLHQPHARPTETDFVKLSESNKILYSQIKQETQVKAHRRFDIATIPKRMFFYWGNSTMSWMRYMTLYSFKKYNPDWEVFLYIGSDIQQKVWRENIQQDSFCYKGPNYMHKVAELGIHIMSAGSHDLPPEHSSDIFSWEMLYKHGGFYSDMDVLFIRDCNGFYEQVKNYDSLICYFDNYYSIGFMASGGNNSYFRGIYHAAIANCSHANYQSAGNLSMNLVARTPADIERLYPQYKLYVIPKNIVYHINQLDVLYHSTYTNYPLEAVGIHWYGGHAYSQAFNSAVNVDNYKNTSNTMTHYLRKVLE
jgi:GT2 family glycosyltransferase